MKQKPYLFLSFFLLLTISTEAQQVVPRADTSAAALAGRMHISLKQARLLKSREDSMKLAFRNRVSKELQQKEKALKQLGAAGLSDSLEHSYAASIFNAERKKMQQAAFLKAIADDRKNYSKQTITPPKKTLKRD